MRGYHDNAGGSWKLSAVVAGHTMQVKERHYEKVERNFERCMRATGNFIRCLWRGGSSIEDIFQNYPNSSIYNIDRRVMKLEVNMRTFLVSIQKEDKFFVARCPELGVTSQGNTLEEAQANIKEAVELYIESFGLEDLPRETSKPFWTTVEVAHA